MTWINRGLGALVEAVLFPFQSLPPLAGLSAVSLLAAVGMLLVLRATSDQPALAAVKRRIRAGLFEIRLFNDDLRAMFSALDVLRHNATYLRLSLVPMLWLMVPFALLIAHLQFYYGYSGFGPGQSAIVKVRLRDAAVPASGAAPAIALLAPDGLSVQSPVVWIPSEREAAWRVGMERQGDYVLTITLDGRPVTKRVRVSDRVGWRTPERREAGFINAVLHPAEPPIAPDIPIEVVSVAYPERQLSLLGQPVGWMPVFFILSLILALVLRARFGIVF